MADTYHGKACPKCGNTERYRYGQLTCRGQCSESLARYHASSKGRAAEARYKATAKGYITCRKARIKQNRPRYEQEAA